MPRVQPKSQLAAFKVAGHVAKPRTREGAVELANIARDIDARGENPFSKMSYSERQQALEALLGVVHSAAPLDAAAEHEKRVGASALLVRIATATHAGGHGSRIAEKAWRELKQIIAADPTSDVAKTALLALHAREKALPPKVAKELRASVKKLAPIAPDYASWDKAGVRQVKIAFKCQDEFYPAWVPFLEGPMGFKLDHVEGDKKIYQRTDDVEGKQTKFTIELQETEEQIFEALEDKDTKVVVWCGHSDWWARVASDLPSAPKQNGEKIFLNMMCFGRHFMHDIMAKYPDLQLVTTKDPTEDPEDQATFEHVLKGLSHGQDWATMARAVRKDPRNPDDNAVFPCDLPDMSYVLDSEGDGRVDSLDTVADSPAPTAADAADAAREIRDHDFVPGPVSQRPGKADGHKVLEAGLLLNSVSYDHELFDRVNLDQNVRADGYYFAKPNDTRAIELRDEVVLGQPILRMRVNNRYAHSHPEALIGMATFEGSLALLGRLRPPIPKTDRVLYAMAVLAHVVENDCFPHQLAAFRHTLQHYGLPVLPRAAFPKIIKANEDWESGSRETLQKLKELVTPEQVKQIEVLAQRIGPRGLNS